MLTDARKSGSVSAAGGARDESVPGKLVEKSRVEFCRSKAGSRNNATPPNLYTNDERNVRSKM